METSEKENDDLDKNRKKHNIGTTISTGKQIYQNSVIDRALKRAGKCKNLKGHINEIMTCDKINLNPKNIIQGKKAVLTKSPTAIRDDRIIKQGSKIVGREQLKDTISKSGLLKTAKQVSNGQYKGTSLVGTKETVQAYNKIKSTHPNVTQMMKSNGISSMETDLLAKKALGASVLENSDKILNQAGKTAKTGAVVSGGLEIINNIHKVTTGQETIKEATKSVANETAIGGTSAAIGDATATGVTMLVATTPAAPIAPVAGTLAGMGVSIITDKGIRKVESSIDKSLKKYAKKKKGESDKIIQRQNYMNAIEEKRKGRIIGNKNISKKMQKKLIITTSPGLVPRNLFPSDIKPIKDNQKKKSRIIF